jgi:WD40 repeat protein
MRIAAVIFVLAALAAGAGSIAGDASASHRSAPIIQRDAVSPIWSPDGKQLLFADVGYASTDYGIFPRELRIVRTSSKPGGRLRTVSREKGQDPFPTIAWAAGSRILVDEDDAISIVAARGGEAKRVVFPGCPDDIFRCTMPGFQLSPNREVAAVTACDCGREPDTIGLLKLNPGKAPAASLAPDVDTGDILTFSPDSTQLIYESSSGGLMALPVAGGDPVPFAQSGIPGADLVPSDVQELQWSPDRRWLEYLEGNDLEAAPTNGESAPRVLATNVSGGIAWSPTSKRIAYTSDGSLMTVGRDGIHPTDVVHYHRRPFRYADVGSPQWSPDGSHLAFTSVGTTEHVWTVRPNGRNLSRRG